MSFPNRELQQIWAPWRIEYFERRERDQDFLTRAGAGPDDEANLVIHRATSCFLIMNRYPYSVGHLMAVPYRKVADISALNPTERMELWELAEIAQRLLRKVAGAQGFNVGLNLGKCSGAGVDDHLHLHIVPRWEADTNFMPVLSGVRVMAEALPQMYRKLREAL